MKWEMFEINTDEVIHGVIYKPWFYLSLWLRSAEQTHLNVSVRLQASPNTSSNILSTAIKTLDQWNRKKYKNFYK